MNPKSPSSTEFPLRLENPIGLRVDLNANGSVSRMDHRDIMLNLFLGTELEGGPANLYLRRLGKTPAATPLLGPGSPATIDVNRHGMTASGKWCGIGFSLRLILADAAPAWFWHLALENTTAEAAALDLIQVQDLGLADYNAVRNNTYYISHYIDHSVLPHPQRGLAVASRQNLPIGGRHPWVVLGALGKGIAYSTDARQFHGLATRSGLSPTGLNNGLPNGRLQHEHAMAAVQETPIQLTPGATATAGFFGWYEENHPPATSTADLAFIDKAMNLPEATPPGKSVASGGIKPAPSLFSAAPLLAAQELTATEITDLYGRERRFEEREDGKLLSFFTGANRHVVLQAKELLALRPHGQIIRTGCGLVPEEAALTTTTWMGGVFNAMLTQGHVSINRLLSYTQSYLGLLRGNGQRIFVELEGRWHLLDIPSAFEMVPEASRWIYKHAQGLIAVCSQAADDRHELNVTAEVLSGKAVRFLVSNHLALNGDDGARAVPVPVSRDGDRLVVRPVPDSEVGRRFAQGSFEIEPLHGTVIESAGADEFLFLDGGSRNQPYLCVITAPARLVGFRIKGRLIAETGTSEARGAPARFWTDMTSELRLHPPDGSSIRDRTMALGEILPWFVQNALVHYLAPRGLEQYTGGGWGTRDISQGPVEMLLALGRNAPVRDLLTRVFKTQNPDGDWPQWFTFFERDRNIRAGDAHGDIVFWPLQALARYLEASQDGRLLDQVLPFFHPAGDGQAETASMWHHLERALCVMGARVIPGTSLAAYGNGDWNDSMQPYDPAMRERLCSSWTVTLHYQTLCALAGALLRLGQTDRAGRLADTAETIKQEFQSRLIVDGVVAGYAYFHADGRIDYLLHPRDRSTGVSYSLLPMIHGITSGLLTSEQAARHLALIRTHLLAPDGARLFDRPMAYRGGPMRHFQRAENAAFFGREIGLMYTHAHLRYAQALACVGDADGFFEALCHVNPVGIRDMIPAANLRQSNCYYSSSDAAFSDRYEAFDNYDGVKNGEVRLDGGWRVYSSGPGIWTRLLMQNFLGLRRGAAVLSVDPVIPPALDGLRAEMMWDGHQITVVYHVRGTGCDTKAVTLNGTPLPYTRRRNPYRQGAVEVSTAVFGKGLTTGANQLGVHLG